jgi:hypothetical protein
VTSPVSKVEFGFTQSSYGVFVYQDVTAYVRSVDVSRGLSRDLDAFSAGSCTVVLDNRDRAFDPSYSSSPYYGEVKPQAAVRITAGGVVVFTGYIDSWSFDYSIVGDQTASFTALDGTTRIASAVVPPQTFSSQYAGARIGSVAASTAVGWTGGTVLDVGQYVLGGDTVGDDVSAWDYIQQVAKADGGAAYISGAGELVFKSGATSDFPSTRTTNRYNLCKVPGFESATITGWTGTRSSTVAYKGSWSLQGTNTTDWYSISPFTPENIYGVKFSDATQTWTANVPYTVSVYVRSTVTQTVTLNAGFKKTTSPQAVDLYTSSQTVTANTWTRLSVTTTKVNGTALNLSVEAASATIYVDAILIEQTSALNEFFDGTYGPTDTATVDYSQVWDGTTNVSTSTLTIVTTYPPNSTDSAVLSDAGGTAIPYTGISVEYGSELNYNKTIVLRAATGTGGTAVNLANGTAYGIRVFTDDQSLIGSDADAQNLANYYLGAFDEPELRVQSVRIDLHALDGNDQETVLTKDIWDSAQVTFTPGGVGSATVTNGKIIGVKHTIGIDRHSVEWNLGTWGNKFRLDSTLLGVLDQNVLGY